MVAIKGGYDHPLKKWRRGKREVEWRFDFLFKTRFGGVDVSGAKCLLARDSENSKLKRLVADLTLINVGLKDVLLKN